MSTSRDVRIGVGTVKVGCVLGDPRAFARVRDAIHLEGGHALRLAQAEILQAAAGCRVAALIYDLEPAGVSAVDFVRQVHTARSDWPMWLYYEARGAIIERVAEVASLRNVWATSQGSGPSHEAEIRVHVRRLVGSVARVRLLYLLDSVLSSLPREVRKYLEVSLEHRDHAGPRSFRVRNGAISPGRLRHLEQVCSAATGMGPKKLLDRLILGFLTFKTFAFDVPLAAAAEQAGLSPKALDRLRYGILGAGIPWPKDLPRAQFALALMALAEACRVPQRVAEEVVEHVAQERRA